MTTRIILALSLTFCAVSLSGCALAVGAGAAIAADKIAEDKKGGDGLF